MKKFFSVISFLIAVLFASAQVNFEEEVTYIDGLIKEGRFAVADSMLIQLKSSLENTSLIAQDTVLLYFSSNLALVNSQLGNCEKTIKYSKEDQSAKARVYGEADLITLAAARNLGIHYLNCDSTSEAKQVLEQTLATHKNQYGAPDEIYVRTLDDLAFTYSRLEETGLAIASYDELISLLGDSKGGFYYNIIENYSSYLISLERYEEAASYFDELKIPLEESPEYAVFLKDYYNVFVHLKDYVKALETASTIASLCQRDPAECMEKEIDRKEFILSAARLAMLLSKFEESKKFYNQAEIAFADSPEVYISILTEEADLFKFTGEKGLQEIKLNVSLEVHEKSNLTDSTSYSRTTLELGKLYTEIGEFKKADVLFSDYINGLETKGVEADPIKLATAYQSLGNQRYFLQNLKDADLYLNKSKNLLVRNSLTKTVEYASTLNSLGALYESFANFKKAESNYRQGLSLTEGVSAIRISLASNLANVLAITQSKNDSIELLLNQAIEWQLELSGENHPLYANMLANRGAFYQRAGVFAQAESDFNGATRIFEYTVSEEHPQYLSALSNLGLLYADNGRESEALELMLKAKGNYERYYSQTHPGFILNLNNLANLYTREEKFDDAESLLMELAGIQVKEIEDSFSYLSESEKRNFVEEKQKLLDNFKGYVVGRTVTEEGSIKPEVLTRWYDLELSTKGMLLNSTKKVRDQIYNSGDVELINLFSDWTAARKQIADIRSMKNVNQLSSQSTVSDLVSKINSLEKEISRKSAGFSSSFAGGATTYSGISSSLESTEASVEIIRTQIGSDAVYVALIGTSGSSAPKIFVLGKGDVLEQKAFKGYTNMITFKVEDASSFETYWKPIHQYLTSNGVEKIYYAPDGVYHKISLVTLYNPTSKKYLLDELEIVQLTSTKDLFDIKREQKTITAQIDEVLLVGRPSYAIGSQSLTSSANTRGIGTAGVADLPGTEAEIQEISDLLKKNGAKCEVRLKDEASEKQVKELLNSKLVHIATHGFFNDKVAGDKNFDPMINAGLLLAGVSNEGNLDGEDGILTAYEIMNLDLSNVDMIVLSACETALGEISSGQGIYGLQRAFFVGGAKTLIMSLWKVDDDATKELMTSFYKEYVKSGDKRAAFVNAQRKIRKKYKSPTYWGAFVMLAG